MTKLNDCLALLESRANPEVALQKARKFGVVAEGSWGVYQKDINELAKIIGKNTALGLELVQHGQYDAVLLASKLIKPFELPEEVIDQIVNRFDTWEMTDSFGCCLVCSTTSMLSAF